MCGIAGLAMTDGSAVDPRILDALTDGVTHRGPDGRGTWIEGNVGLGHRRLKILDLSEAAAQPMASHDRNWVVTFNGEIYNFAELRAELEAKGHRFRSTGDTEVMAALFETQGIGAVTRLRGMFAFAAYDRKMRMLYLVRDRLGKKPIHYATIGSTFAFASECKALRTLPQCPREIDRSAIHRFLRLGYVPSPDTGIAGIHKLPAAHVLTLDCRTGKHTVAPYWTLRFASEKRSAPEWEAAVLALLEESVKLRMIADVPLGAFLSGGLDSSTVVALMQRLSAHPVRTFAIGSDTNKSEHKDAERVARHLGTDHTTIILEPNVATLLPTLVAAYETPFGDPSAIPTYLLCNAVRKHVTVALSGDGGDENFAGYLRYPILRLGERHRWMGLFAPLARLMHVLHPTTKSYRTKEFLEGLRYSWPERYLTYFGHCTEEEARTAMGRFAPQATVRSWYAAQTASARARAGDLVHKAMAMDDATFLPDDLMPKVDLGAMAHGLEVRAPFLDHRLLELTAAMPLELKLQGWTTKVLLRKIAAKLLPPETLQKKKQGFRMPLDRWFRADLKDFVHDRLLTAPSAVYDVLDREGIETLLRRYDRSSVDYSPQIWQLLWLSEWISQQSR